MDTLNTPKSQRIAKRIARAGICSRRKAEDLIAAGRVRVNDKTLTTPAITVVDGDIVEVDGKVLNAPQKARMWRYHKPCGLVTTHKDEGGKKTVFDALPSEIGRVISVGRLDKDTSGLLLLTNDGDLARSLELPSSGWRRTYRARVRGKVTQSALDTLTGGVNIDGIKYRPIIAKLGVDGWVTLTLTEGKKHEARKVMEHLGHPIRQLIRVSFGEFKLEGLQKGEIAQISDTDVKRLCESQ